MNYVDAKLHARRTQVVEVLEMVCESLELSNAQFAQAKQRYEGVGACLAGAEDPVLRAISIYLQGSTALRTTVRPIGVNEHDVDLVAHVTDLEVEMSPAALKRAIGDCLRANGNYAPLLEEMPRCWRLSYANEFHMDITPSIPNPNCRFGGELVPDKTLKMWKASNPKGYKQLFEERAKLAPVIRLRKHVAVDSAGANVEPYPGAGGFKGILRRSVQIAKRHRDIMFVDEPDVAPLSVIITTLASRSYEWCVTNREYENELELLFDVIRHMPDTIQIRHVEGRVQWFIWNETASGENFAEKWNRRPEPAEAFYAWHQRFSSDLALLEAVSGLDRLGDLLKGLFGSRPATAAIDSITERVSTARRAGNLRVGPAVGVSVGAIPASTSVRANTFYGNSRR
jgi:Second Messenger Oligonucleotide or Dinucleotide Synthetase domain